MEDPLFEDDMVEKVKSETNSFENLLRKIPGFKGYLEMRDRREADQLLRETIAGRLEEVRLKFAGIHEDLSSDIIKAIDFAEPLGRIDNRLMGLASKIKDAPQGYSGFFDAVKVDKSDLDELYAFDDSLMTHGESIALGVDKLGTAVREDGEIKAAIRELDQTVKEANETFNSRNEVLTGFK